MVELTTGTFNLLVPGLAAFAGGLVGPAMTVPDNVKGPQPAKTSRDS